MDLEHLTPRRPFNYILAFAYTLSIIARLPYWLTRYTVPSQRPCAQWSYNQAMRVRVLRAILYIICLVRKSRKRNLAPGKTPRWQFVVLPEFPDRLYTGPLACNEQIRPAEMGGTWYPREPSPEDVEALKRVELPLEVVDQAGTGEKRPAWSSEHVVLHIHGGAFAVGSSRPEFSRFASKTLLKDAGAKFVFMPEYRLASTSEGAFPAALQDVFTTVLYLTQTLGIPLRRITLSGDSAGANLALGMVRYMDEYGSKLQLDTGTEGIDSGLVFNAVLIWSIFHDPTYLWHHPGAWESGWRGQRDYVHESFGLWGAAGLLGPLLHTGNKGIQAERYAQSETLNTWKRFYNFSGAQGAFTTKNRLWFEVGECEAMFEEQMAVWGAFAAIEGNDVGGAVQEATVHDVLLCGGMLSMESACSQAGRRVGWWMRGEYP